MNSPAVPIGRVPNNLISECLSPALPKARFIMGGILHGMLKRTVIKGAVWISHAPVRIFKKGAELLEYRIVLVKEDININLPLIAHP